MDRIIWIMLLVLSVSTACLRADESMPTQPTTAMPLFNGTDLTGWYSWLNGKRGQDPQHVFRVADGCIRISGTQPGYLASVDSYRNYRLTAEFRWGSSNERGQRARDSGLFLHSRGPDGNSYDANGAFQAGIECQIMQGAIGDLMLIRGRDGRGQDYPLRLTSRIATIRDQDGWPFHSPTGSPITLTKWGRLNWERKSRSWRDRIDMRSPTDVEHPVGNWNQLVCICQGDRITIQLNGTVINNAYDVWPASGQILLQSEGSEIFFRNFSLSPLANFD